MTQYIGLIGYPLKHSISPDFQQAALDYYQLDIRYKIWETRADELLSVVNQLRHSQNLGANVTVPYKEKVIGLLDEVDKQAKLIGAVNTVVNNGGKLIGFNTDVYGFIQALRKDIGFELRDKHVVLFGAGGVARAASFALITENISSLTITNRTLERAEFLVESLREYVKYKKPHLRIEALPWESLELKEALKSCQLIVNCTTLGMRHSADKGELPLVEGAIPPSALVYDLVYNPSETPLLKMATKVGARILSGLPMLVYQGAAAFELWTGKKAPVDIMFSTAKAAMNRL